MFAAYEPDQSQPNTQESYFLPQIPLDSSFNNPLFNQKFFPEDEAEGKVEIPGDIKSLFEAEMDKFSDFGGHLTPTGSYSNWDRSDGDLTPMAFKLGKTKKAASFKVPSSFSNQKLSGKNLGTGYSPKVSSCFSPNHRANFHQRAVSTFLHSDSFPKGTNFSNLIGKPADNPQDTFSMQKLSLASVKTSVHCNFVCPFCTQVIHQIDNTETSYAYVMKSSKRIYLAHSECYFSSPKEKISLHSKMSLATVSYEPTFFSAINFIEAIKDNKRASFLKMEGFHPISSSKLFKIEKTFEEICMTTDETQYLYMDLKPQSSSFFEPTGYTLPFNEFKLTLCVNQAQSQEDAYHYQFNVDLSDFRMTSDEGKSKSVELLYKYGGNCLVILGVDIQWNVPKDEFLKKLDNKSHYYHSNLQNSLVTFKYLALALPLKRTQGVLGRTLTKNSPQFENPSSLNGNKDLQSSFSSFTNTSTRLKIFKDQQDHKAADSLNNSGSIIVEQVPLLPFPQGHTSPIKNHTTIHQAQYNNNNKASSWTSENSPANKNINSPAAKVNRPANESNPSKQTLPNFSSAVSNEGADNANDEDGEFKLEEHLDRLPQFAKTYKGSKVLQEFVVKASKTDLDKVIMKIANNAADLMLDPYANYMVQILAKHACPEQRYALLQKIGPAMVRIACDKKGTYALQTIVSLINTNAEDLLMKSAISSHVLEMTMDNQGNHVIQKLINAISLKNIEFIYQPLMENFLHVATHSAGSLVFKQLIIKVEKMTNLKMAIIHTVCQEMENLVQDPYGNYVIQYAIEYYPRDCGIIQQKIVNKLIPYSSQKFSSNIIEKSLAVGDSSFRKKIAAEILKNDRLPDLLKNKYGNYVILHTLAICDTEDKCSIMQGIHKCVYSFQGTKYKLRWTKFLEENPLNIHWNVGSPTIRSPQKTNNGQFDFTEENHGDNNTTKPTMNDDDLKRLEIVKKIWRDMNKEEKKETPQHNGKNYSNYEEYTDSNNGSPSHVNYENPTVYYPDQYNFSLTANKVEKWY